jgi:hypothetical protein
MTRWHCSPGAFGWRPAASSLFEDMPEGLVGKFILYLHVRIFARRCEYPFKAASIRACRSALAWLHEQTSCVARIPQEPEWFTVYPRVLFVCDVTTASW